jgi:hypothetical protein
MLNEKYNLDQQITELLIKSDRLVDFSLTFLKLQPFRVIRMFALKPYRLFVVL